MKLTGAASTRPLADCVLTDSTAPIPANEPSHVVVGLVLGPHGAAGQLRVKILSDVPHRFDPGQELYLRGQPHRILSSAFRRPDRIILQLSGLNTPGAARALAGEEVTAPASSAPPLPEGEYFHFQLIGLQALTEEGENLGQISEIIATGSNDVYVVSGPGGEILLPALAQVIRSVDLPAGTMTVRLLEGLR